MIEVTTLSREQVLTMFPGAEEKFTEAEMRTLLTIMDAVAEAIRDMTRLLGGVPSGHLYASLMGTMSLTMYQTILSKLKQAGLVKEQGHFLRWIGVEDQTEIGPVKG